MGRIMCLKEGTFSKLLSFLIENTLFHPTYAAISQRSLGQSGRLLPDFLSSRKSALVGQTDYSKLYNVLKSNIEDGPDE